MRVMIKRVFSVGSIFTRTDVSTDLWTIRTNAQLPSREHGSSKTELLKLIATELHIKPSRCIYAGDEIQDIKAAVETGMIPIVTGYGGFYSPELLRAAMKEYSIPESRLVLKPENLGVVIARLLDKAN